MPRCCIRYIVMSMSLRERAVWRRPAASSPQASTISRSTKKNRSSQRAVVPGLLHLGDVETVERVADDARVGARHDPLLREHDQVGVVDGISGARNCAFASSKFSLRTQDTYSGSKRMSAVPTFVRG